MLDILITVDPFYSRFYMYPLGHAENIQSCCGNKRTSIVEVPGRKPPVLHQAEPAGHEMDRSGDAEVLYGHLARPEIMMTFGQILDGPSGSAGFLHRRPKTDCISGFARVSTDRMPHPVGA